MGYPDLELARGRQAALRRAIDEHGEGADPRRLRRVLALCRELGEAVDDEYCRRKVLAVEECAAELLTLAGARVEFLKRRIREALELVQSRLYSLERTRRLGAAPAPRGHPAPGRGLSARYAG